jgi:predicted secreted acid phosphatase
MIIPLKDKKEKRIEINLNSSHGNAFALINLAKRLCDQLDKDFEPIKERMMSSDYENLLKVLEEEFGDYVIMYR